MKRLSHLSQPLAAAMLFLFFSVHAFAEMTGHTGPSANRIALRNSQPPAETGMMSPAQAAFTENKGQVLGTDGRRRTDILFSTAPASVRVFFGAARVSYVFSKLGAPAAGSVPGSGGDTDLDATAFRVDMDLAGANSNVRVHGEDLVDGTSNYYVGISQPLADVRSFRRIVYENVYDNIDLIFRLSDSGVKYEFIVRPGGRVSDIRIRYSGARDVSLQQDGSLRVVSPLGDVREAAPFSFQTDGSTLEPAQDTPEIASSFRLTDGELRFDVAEYDRSRTLVIDPTVQWSTYYGANYIGKTQGVAVDSSGNVIVCGFTFSTQMPVNPGAHQNTNAGNADAFIVKFNSAGVRQWATYFGGSANDTAQSIAVDGAGNVIITGQTFSNNFPVTGTAFQGSSGGQLDAFLAKFSPSGALTWSTYFGGTAEDHCYGVSVDASGSICITGTTMSTNLPVTAGAFQMGNAGNSDAFVAKFTPAGAQDWATYYGGSSYDGAAGIAIDRSGNVIFVGGTLSPNFPLSGSPFQSIHNGFSEGYVAKLDASGAPLWSTFLGGYDNDAAMAVAVDYAYNVCVTGVTASNDFPVTPGSFQPVYPGQTDAFLVKFTATGARIFGTYYGANLEEIGYGIGTDRIGNIVVVGQTTSTTFPVTLNAFQTSKSGLSDAFVAKFTSLGTPLWSTYYGGGGDESAMAVAVQHGGNVMLGGWTSSSNFPVTGNAAVKNFSGTTDPFITKICDLKPVITAIGNLHLCSGTSVRLDAGPGYTSYSWSTGANTRAITVFTPGRYAVTATDGSGCTATSDTLVVNASLSLDVDAGNGRSVCIGSGSQIGNNATGGVAPYSYHWRPITGLSDTTIARPVATPTVTTKYFVTVTDLYGCTRTDSVTVTVRQYPTVNAGIDTVICHGGSKVIGNPATGGTSPYIYSWFPAAGLSSSTVARPTASPDTTTRYIVTVTDGGGNGCTTRDTIVVHVNRVFPHAGPDRALCQNDSLQIGLVATGGTGGYTYVWSPKKGLSDSTVMRPWAKPDTTSTYILTVMDNSGCTAKDTVTVRVYTSLAALAGPDKVVCPGGSTMIGDTAVCGTPAYTYSWSPLAGLNDSTILHPIASPSSTTTYVLTVTDGVANTLTDTMTVRVNAVLNVNAGVNDTICARSGKTIGSTATGGTPPYRYSWSPATGLNSRTIETPFASPATTTLYTVTVTDAVGCSSMSSVLISVSDLAINAGPDHLICYNDTMTIGGFATGGKLPYTYSWSPGTGLNTTNVARPRAFPLVMTTYIETVTDAEGCVVRDTVVVLGRPYAHRGPNSTICEGDSANLGGFATDGVPPYTYHWNPVIGLSDSTAAAPSASPPVTTTYRLTVTDAMGCQHESGSVTVNVVPLPKPRVLASRPLTMCEGETLVLKSDSSYLWRYLWSNGSTADSIIVTETGIYYVTVTGYNGCVATSPIFPVTVYPRPVVQIKPLGSTSFCAGGSVELDAGPGFASYLWTPGGATTRKITVNSSGSYSVSVTDLNGCSAQSLGVSVVVNPLPVPTITPGGPTTFCEGGQVTLDAGTGFAQYLWSNGSNTRSISVTAPGSYSVTVWTGAGCSGTSAAVTVSVNLPPAPKVVALEATTFCNGDSVHLDAGTGYSSYLWSNGRRTQIITVKNPGTYAVTVTDANGCTGTSAAVAVTVYSKPIPVITAGSALSFCPGDSVILDAGANFVNYSWSNGETTRRITVKTSGTFSVTVVNTNGCEGSSSPVIVTRYQTPQPTITANGSLTFCAGGSVELDAGSGWASYQWSTGARTRRITVTQSGLYNVRVENMNGCSGESPVVDVKVKSNPPAPIISQNNNTLICTPATRYQWNYSGAPIAGANGRTHTASRSGQYTVTIWSADSCSSTSAIYDFRYTGIEKLGIVSGFSVYPDPSNGLVTVDLRLAVPSAVRISVSNVLGQRVLSINDEASDQTYIKLIDMQHLPSGLYYLHVQTGEDNILRKIIKQ